MNQSIRILHLEDDATDAELAQAILESAGIVCRITRVQTREEFGEALRQGGYNIILADYRLPAYDGMSALRLAQQLAFDVPFIFVSGAMGEDAAIEGLTEGATDYVLKHKLTRLVPAVMRALRDAENRRERKRAEAELRESEEKFRTVADHIHDWEYWEAQDGSLFFISPSCKQITGYSIEEFYQDPGLLSRVIHPDDREKFIQHKANAAKNIAKKDSSEEIFRILTRSGKTRWIAHACQEVFNKEGKSIGRRISNVDITARKRAEDSLRRLNRELRAISNCNQVLIRSEDEQTLLNDICRIICDEAGYRMAWVGYAEYDEAKTVRPVAWAGNEIGYLADANITWADTERGRGPTGTAIRSGESAYIQDFATDPKVAPWRENALLRGYRSTIGLPLKDESAKAFGALTIYSMEPNAFTNDEIQLLERLAEDLAFGIMVLRTRTERKLAEEALSRLNEELDLRVKQRTAELEQKNAVLDKMNRLFVGRELRMKELKEKIAQMEGNKNRGIDDQQ